MSNTIRLTKIFHFEAAHSLFGYDGKCSNLHGHSYTLHITVKGSPTYNSSSPKDGMYIDFKELKRVVEDNIISIYDHSLILSDNSPLVQELSHSYNNIHIFPFRPTTENLISFFADSIKDKIKNIGGELYSLRLYETASSYAEWFAEDNK